MSEYLLSDGVSDAMVSPIGVDIYTVMVIVNVSPLGVDIQNKVYGYARTS